MPSKPCFVMFAGVDERGLTDEDLAKLPPEIRPAYSQCDDWNPGVNVVVEGLEIESFDFGRHDTDDPGHFAGFGVAITRGWGDAETQEVDEEKIHKREAVRKKLQALFDRYQLSVKVRILQFAGYGG